MKNNLFIFFLSIISVGFSQQKIVKQVFSVSEEIEINTLGLDTITIITSDDNQTEVSLFNENANSEDLIINSSNKTLHIDFKKPFIVKKDGVFRKFITKRLNRSYAIVKIPKNKMITIFGRNINIISKSYQGNIVIFIDKGDLHLNTIQGKTSVHLFQGTVHAIISKTNININTKNGTIMMKGKKQASPFRVAIKNVSKKLVVNSINAHVFINSN